MDNELDNQLPLSDCFLLQSLCGDIMMDPLHVLTYQTLMMTGIAHFEEYKHQIELLVQGFGKVFQNSLVS
jgi:hypothetical protein